jgi:hypothetical protein
MDGKTSWFAALGVRVVLVLGVAYVSLWWSYQEFYSVFGVAPDDVGFTPSGGLGDIIGAVLRLGLWLSVALIVLGLLPVAVVGAVMYAIERKRDTRDGPHGPIADLKAAREWLRGETVQSTDEATSEPRTPWKSRIAVWAVTIGGAFFLAVLVFAYGKLIGWIYAGVVIALIVMITFGWGSLGASVPVEKAAAGDTPAGFTVRWWQARQWWLLRTSDIFLVVAVVGVLFIDLPRDAHEVARKLLARVNTVRECKVPAIGAPIDWFELDLLGVHALPARFAADTLPKGLPEERPFSGVYLGTANGWLVIYRKTTRQVLRIPASSGISVRVDAGLKGCPGVHGPNEQRK